jgi:hypothetical protein
VAKAGLAAAGVDGRDDAGIAGELAWGVEAIDGSDLSLDGDGQDVPNAGECLQQLDGVGEGNPVPDAHFELSDLVPEAVESFELLGDAAPGFRGKP